MWLVACKFAVMYGMLHHFHFTFISVGTAAAVGEEDLCGPARCSSALSYVHKLAQGQRLEQ